MTAENVRNSTTPMVTPISAGHRLRALRSLHARLIRFPQQDEVLSTLAARWPALFADSVVIGQTEPPNEPDGLSPGSANQDNTAVHLALADELATARQEIAGLQAAVISNRHIGMAVGVLMAQHQLTPDQAFDLLRKTSQRSNRKLRDIAGDVTFTGTLPDHCASGCPSPSLPQDYPAPEVLA